MIESALTQLQTKITLPLKPCGIAVESRYARKLRPHSSPTPPKPS